MIVNGGDDGFAIRGKGEKAKASVFPIVICQPGSYKLSGNLTVSGTANGINITANNVLLDLNGFSIFGPVTCDDNGNCTGSGRNGVWAALFPSRGITIRNGTITGMSAGVIVHGEGALIEDIHAIANGGIGITAGFAVIRRNTALRNKLDGIRCTQGCTVSENAAAFNGVGINAAFSSISNNTVTNNRGDGIDALGCNVVGNTAILNSQYGLRVDSGSLYGSNNAPAQFHRHGIVVRGHEPGEQFLWERYDVLASNHAWVSREGSYD